MTDTPTGIDDLREKAKPRETTARILLDATMLAEHAHLEQQLVEVVQQRGDGLGTAPSVAAKEAELAAQLVALEAAIHDAEDEFVFRSIGSTKWIELQAANPPRPGDKVGYNPFTFPPAAVAASCASRDLGAADAAWLMANLDLSEWGKLWGACLEVNIGEDGRPKSQLASVLLRSNGTSSGTAAPGESLAASS